MLHARGVGAWQSPGRGSPQTSLLTLHLCMRLVGNSPGTVEPFEPLIAHIAGKEKREVRRTCCRVLTRSWTATTIGADSLAMRIDHGWLFEKAERAICAHQTLYDRRCCHGE